MPLVDRKNQLQSNNLLSKPLKNTLQINNDPTLTNGSENDKFLQALNVTAKTAEVVDETHQREHVGSAIL